MQSANANPVIWATTVQGKAYVYVITNLVNGKLYVGKTTEPVVRWRNHRLSARKGKTEPLYVAIREFGVENFTYTVVMARDSEEEAYKWESYWEKILDSRTTGNGYNKKRAGHGITSVLNRATKNPRNSGQYPGKRSAILGQVSDLSKQGLSNIQIGEQIGRSACTVYQLLQETGTVPSSARGNAKVEAMARAVELHNQGLNLTQIAKQIGRGQKNVRRLLAAAGVRQPEPVRDGSVQAERNPIIWNLRSQGMTTQEIVAKTGFSKASVHRGITKHPDPQFACRVKVYRPQKPKQKP